MNIHTWSCSLPKSFSTTVHSQHIAIAILLQRVFIWSKCAIVCPYINIVHSTYMYNSASCKSEIDVFRSPNALWVSAKSCLKKSAHEFTIVENTNSRVSMYSPPWTHILCRVYLKTLQIIYYGIKFIYKDSSACISVYHLRRDIILPLLLLFSCMYFAGFYLLLAIHKWKLWNEQYRQNDITLDFINGMQWKWIRFLNDALLCCAGAIIEAWFFRMDEGKKETRPYDDKWFSMLKWTHTNT